ncbi:MAG TPA: sortase [Verrucomicrobiae bacterium]|nr:sortase [Verrucomicrobiae bacterium]
MQIGKSKFNWKRLGLAVAPFLLLFVAINFPYFLHQIKYFFRKPPMVFQDPNSFAAQEKIEPNTLIINSLGIKFPVVYVDEINEDVFQDALQYGVVHYPDTALPGQFGNVYIFGHSSDYAWARGNYKTAFTLLPRIQKGTQIMISDSEGKPYIYKVIETKVVKPTDLSVLDQQNNSKKLLSLQTSYPLGTAISRFIVVAEIEE